MVEQDRSEPLLRTAPGDTEGARLAVLRLLADEPDMSQREVSERLGLSLGKTHYVLRALLDKGLVKIRNFRRSDNKLRYAYVLTPRGITERVKLTQAFLARKEREYSDLAAQIALLRDEVDRTASQDRSAASTRS